jgi:hypothetical protein
VQTETALKKDNLVAQYCGIDPMWIDDFLYKLMSGRSESHEDDAPFLSTEGQKKEEGAAAESCHGEKNE